MLQMLPDQVTVDGRAGLELQDIGLRHVSGEDQNHGQRPDNGTSRPVAMQQGKGKGLSHGSCWTCGGKSLREVREGSAEEEEVRRARAKGSRRVRWSGLVGLDAATIIRGNARRVVAAAVA